VFRVVCQVDTVGVSLAANAEIAVLKGLGLSYGWMNRGQVGGHSVSEKGAGRFGFHSTCMSQSNAVRCIARRGGLTRYQPHNRLLGCVVEENASSLGLLLTVEKLSSRNGFHGGEGRGGEKYGPTRDCAIIRSDKRLAAGSRQSGRGSVRSESVDAGCWDHHSSSVAAGGRALVQQGDRAHMGTRRHTAMREQIGESIQLFISRDKDIS